MMKRGSIQAMRSSCNIISEDNWKLNVTLPLFNEAIGLWLLRFINSRTNPINHITRMYLPTSMASVLRRSIDWIRSSPINLSTAKPATNGKQWQARSEAMIDHIQSVHRCPLLRPGHLSNEPCISKRGAGFLERTNGYFLNPRLSDSLRRNIHRRSRIDTRCMLDLSC